MLLLTLELKIIMVVPIFFNASNKYEIFFCTSISKLIKKLSNNNILGLVIIAAANCTIFFSY